MRYFLFFAAVCFLIGCAQQAWQRAAWQQDIGFNGVPASSGASLAFFSESNLSHGMRLEYATALQKAGIYNFKTEIFSEEQIEKGVEIRLNYKEEKRTFSRAPILVLQAEFYKNGLLWNRFTLIENSDKFVNTPRGIKSEVKFRQKVLLERFLEETKRLQLETPLENNNA